MYNFWEERVTPTNCPANHHFKYDPGTKRLGKISAIKWYAWIMA